MDDYRRSVPVEVRADADLGDLYCVLSTEEPVAMDDWQRFETVDEILIASGADPIPAKVPMQDSHSRESCLDNLGSMRDLAKVGGAIQARMVFDQNDPKAKLIEGKYRDGHLTDVSVGYRVVEATYIEPGRTAQVAGRSFTAATNRAMKVTTKWRIREGSPTPIGADEKAKVRKAWEQARAEHFAKRERGAAMPDSVRAADAPQEQKVQEAPAPIDVDAIRAQATQKERERVKSIRARAGETVPQTVVDECIDKGLDLGQAAIRMLDHVAAQRSAPVASPGLAAEGSRAPQVFAFGNYETSQQQRLMDLAAGVRHQVSPKRSTRPFVHPAMRGDADFAKQCERASNEGHQLRNLSTAEYCKEALRAIGERAPRGDADAVRSYLVACRRQKILSGRSFASAMDLDSVFTSTFEAELVGTYEEAPDTTSGWVSETDVPNYKTNERPRMSNLSHLKKVGEGGKAGSATTEDTVEEYKVFRYAEDAVFDEIAMINDRLGALTTIPRLLARAAARVRPDLVYYILGNGESAGLAAGALFASIHTGGQGNLLSSSALSNTTIQTAIETMMKQTEAVKGETVILNIMPTHLVCPVALRFAAMRELNSAFLVGDDESGNANVVQGALVPVADARLDHGVKDPDTGLSSTGDAAAWYLVGAGHPTIEVGYVRGTGRVPSVRSTILDKGQWGIHWDVAHSVGAKALDFRALLKAND